MDFKLSYASILKLVFIFIFYLSLFSNDTHAKIEINVETKK